jgi:hypothetical protein
MQEHIRRAHPEHYIPKLPATEESFLLMINSPPTERRADQAPTSTPQSLCPCHVLLHTRHELVANACPIAGAHDRRNYYRDGSSNPGTPRHSDEYTTSGGGPMLGTVSAAAALAELHGIKSERDMDSDVSPPSVIPMTVTDKSVSVLPHLGLLLRFRWSPHSSNLD